jgi:hypothetical protein
LALLLRITPYSAKCDISANCCRYADCVSAAVGGGGDAEALFVAGAAIRSRVLGPENTSELRRRENKYADESTQQPVEPG